MDLKTLTLSEVCDVMASSAPVPGGGSAAAIAGAFAASLLEMCAQISLRRASERDAAAFTDISARSGRGRNRMLELASLDTAAYAAVVNARRLPKDSDQDIRIRKDAIMNSAKQAASVPLETATLARDIKQMVPMLKDKGNPNVASDLDVANRLADVAFAGGRANVEANLPDLCPEDRDMFIGKLRTLDA